MSATTMLWLHLYNNGSGTRTLVSFSTQVYIPALEIEVPKYRHHVRP